MEHVKRLVLMPEHMAENTTQSKPLVPPLTSQVNHLDSEMDSLLKRQDITQDEKANNTIYYMVMGVLPTTKTLVFSIFSLVKI